MLQKVWVAPSARRAVRRAMHMGCELLEERGSAQRQVISDLSPLGVRLEVDRALEVGQSVFLAFAHERLSRRIEAIGRVAHVHPRDSHWSAGIAFESLEDEFAADLEHSLAGIPPTLTPGAPWFPEMVWVDAVVSWSEDLGDRWNAFSAPSSVVAEMSGELSFEALAPVLSGARSTRH